MIDLGNVGREGYLGIVLRAEFNGRRPEDRGIGRFRREVGEPPRVGPLIVRVHAFIIFFVVLLRLKELFDFILRHHIVVVLQRQAESLEASLVVKRRVLDIALPLESSAERAVERRRLGRAHAVRGPSLLARRVVRLGLRLLVHRVHIILWAKLGVEAPK